MTGPAPGGDSARAGQGVIARVRRTAILVALVACVAFPLSEIGAQEAPKPLQELKRETRVTNPYVDSITVEVRVSEAAQWLPIAVPGRSTVFIPPPDKSRDYAQIRIRTSADGGSPVERVYPFDPKFAYRITTRTVDNRTVWDLDVVLR
jgi:hypothetical protein